MTIEQEARNEATRRAWDGELSHTDRDGFRARIDASEAFERGYIAGASRPVTDEMVLAGLNAEQPRAATFDLTDWHPDNQARTPTGRVGRAMSAEGHECWEDCDEGPHGCVCGNECEPPEWVREQDFRDRITADFKAGRIGVLNGWLVEYNDPCPSPCAGVEYGCPPSCSATPLVDLWAASRAAAALAEQGETKVFSTQVAPLGFDVTPDMVQGVWDTFVKPSQSDDAPPQSAEMRVLMAILRGVYMALAPAPDTTNNESEDKR